MSNSRPLIDLDVVAIYLLEALEKFAPLKGKWSTEADGDVVDVNYRLDRLDGATTSPWHLAWIKVEGPILEIHPKSGPVPRINLSDPDSGREVAIFLKNYLERP